ncbi:hypothetical protein V7457_18625 [Bacillus toyonensis]
MESYSTVSIYNCHTDRRTINIWVDNGSGWEEIANLNHQYDESDYCPIGEPYMFELKDGFLNHIVCVDVGAIECGVNDPDKLACQRFEITIQGNSNGPAHPKIVVS